MQLGCIAVLVILQEKCFRNICARQILCQLFNENMPTMNEKKKLDGRTKRKTQIFHSFRPNNKTRQTATYHNSYHLYYFIVLIIFQKLFNDVLSSVSVDTFPLTKSHSPSHFPMKWFRDFGNIVGMFEMVTNQSFFIRVYCVWYSICVYNIHIWFTYSQVLYAFKYFCRRWGWHGLAWIGMGGWQKVKSFRIFIWTNKIHSHLIFFLSKNSKIVICIMCRVPGALYVIIMCTVQYRQWNCMEWSNMYVCCV